MKTTKEILIAILVGLISAIISTIFINEVIGLHADNILFWLVHIPLAILLNLTYYFVADNFLT